MLRDFRLSPLNGGAPSRVVMFLHGLGDRGDGGLLSIGQIWQRALPDAEFICPDAPFAYDMAPPDFGGRQWFSLQGITANYIDAGLTTAAPILNAYIDDILRTRNLKASQLALVGFSQGTMMALHVAPRREEPVACVVGYSGLLSDAKLLTQEKRSSPPVLLVHGTHDEVVPFAHMGEAERGLKAAGITVESLACQALGHSISDQGVLAGLKFLQKHL